MTVVSREQAWNLFCEWTQAAALRRHVLGVEACMLAYAPRFDGDPELWAATAILHDLDYERHPDPEAGHPRMAIAELTERGYPQVLIDAVAAHADYMGVPRTTELARALYACDELSGFVHACALVRPTGIEGMTPKSVRKKLKTPGFAAAVDRDAIRRGAEELGMELGEHAAVVIEAMAARAETLGLAAHQVGGAGSSSVAGA